MMKRIKKLLLFITPYFLLSCGGTAFSEKKSNKSNVIATIELYHQGCWSSGHSKLQILEQNGERTALFTNDSNLVYKTILDSNRLSEFNKFIGELKEKDFNDGCTETSDYTVSIGKEKFKKTDGSCSWGGFGKLLQSLYPAMMDSLFAQ